MINWRAFLSKFESDPQSASRPPAAVEIAPGGVLAVYRPQRGDAPVYAFKALPAGAVVPGVSEINLRSAGAVADAVRSVLENVSPDFHAVTIVLPDLAVRVFILNFDSLPDDSAEAVSILRFRIRKLVPFDVANAKISYEILSRQQAQCRVLAVIIPGPILSEYENAVYAAGYEPGAVLPSGLAALAATDSDEPVLGVSHGERSLTTFISHRSELLLYRTHELPEDPVFRLSELQHDIAVAVAFFEDNLMSRPQALCYAGIATAEEFARTIAMPDLPVACLAPPPGAADVTLPHEITNIAGLTGALAAAR